ncbi:hypothetical protein BSKO_11232 [Bryopsis sp. KO-2023]|nr:hypothetical protein BSKO_11232 [Bryopsis sp. KO-2023]
MRHLAAKAWYLSFFSMYSLVNPYLNLYYRRLGFNERAVGVLAGIQPWVFGPSGYFWSAFADMYRKHKVILIGTLIASIVCKTLIGFSHAYWLLIGLVALAQFFTSPSMTIADTAVVALCKQDGSYGRQRMWGAVGWGISSFVIGGLITVFGIMAAFVCFPIVGIFTIMAGCALDMSLLTVPDDAEQRDAPQQLELCPTGGKGKKDTKLVLETSSEESDGQSIAVVVVESPNGSSNSETHVSTSDAESVGEDAPEDVNLLAGKQNTCESKESENELGGSLDGGNASFLSKLKRVLMEPEVAIFVLMAFLMGIAAGTIENFLFLYLDQLGAPEYLMGLSLLVTCSAEVPIFFVMDHILRYVGIQATLHMVMGTFIVRLVAYVMLASMGSPWWVLLIEPLHGVTFGCAWGAGTEYSRRIAPPGLDATLQSIFSGMYFGLGYGTGALVGGAVFKEFGPRIMFAVTASIVSIGWGICLVAIAILGTRRSKYQNLQG